MKKCFTIILTAAILLCGAPLAGFTAIDLPETDFGKLFNIPAHAAEIVASGTCGLIDEANGLDGSQVTWTLDADGLLTISGNGEMSGNCRESWIDFISAIKKVVIQHNVTNIGDSAFALCRELTSVTIPDSVVSIGGSAFTLCKELTSVTIPDSVVSIGSSAFFGCTGLTSIELPQSVTSIGESAFEGCLGLTSVEIPDGVTEICDYTFRDCKGLTSITIPEGVQRIGGSALANCPGLTTVTIPEGVTTIGESAFCFCFGLTSVRIPRSVSKIDKDTFATCRALEDVYILNPACEIDATAFDMHSDAPFNAVIHGCAGSTAETFAKEKGLPFEVIEDKPAAPTEGTCGENLTWTLDENGVLTIRGTGDMDDFEDSPAPWGGSDENRSRIKKVVIEDGVTSIGSNAFALCRDLTNVSIPEGVTRIGEYAFAYSGLTEVSLPNTVGLIESQSFGGCGHLTKVAIPDGVTEIAPFAFCSSGLKKLIIGDGVVTIGQAAFMECGDLETVTLGAGIKTIGMQAFYSGPYHLTDVYYNGTEEMWKAVDVGDYNFSSKVTIHFTHDHIWDSGTVTTPATSDEYGEMTYTCTVCGITKTEKIEKLPVAPKIEAETAKEQDGMLFGVSQSAAELLALAGDDTLITKPDGTTLTEQDVVGSGMTLTKSDGTSLTIVVKGDNDGDGKVSSGDARLALRRSVFLENFTDWQTAASVMSGENKVTSADARLILRASVGLETLPLV